MVTVVVVLNVLISLLCLYVAWQVWNLRRTLASVVQALTIAERNTYAVLHGAPNAIDKGQLGVHELRARYQQLELQLQQVQKVLTLLGLLQSLWRSGVRLSSSFALNSRASRKPVIPLEEHRAKARSQSRRLQGSPRYRNRR